MSLRSISRRRMAVVVAVPIVMLVSAKSGLGVHDLLCLAPALLLLGTLFARRYPGERLLLGVAARERNSRRRCAEGRVRPSARTAGVPRGGLLMGFALAVRPPPCSPAAS